MSVLSTRAVVVLAWVVLFALMAVLAQPFGATTRIPQPPGLALVGLALLALMVPAILALVARTRTPHGAVVEVLPSIDVDSPTVVTVTRRVLRIVVSAGARFWHVEGVPAAIRGRTRAASDARDMMRSGHYNRSRGQASRGLGLRHGSRGRAGRATADAVSSSRVESDPPFAPNRSRNRCLSERYTTKSSFNTS
jgi:hypothetical protein